MRILLATEYFYPISRGGTEMYVYQLAKELLLNGHECMVLSLSNDLSHAEYEGIQISYIPFIEDISQEVENPSNYESLSRIVKDFQPDIFHLHTYTPSIGINHLKKLSKESVVTVFTAHITSFSCIRGDLMLNGNSVCDGVLNKERCLNCYMLKQGVKNSNFRRLIIQLSNSRLIKLLYSPINVYYNKLSSIEKFQRYVDHIVVVSKWQEDVLLKNNFNKNNLSICRQAVNRNIIINQKPISSSNVLKIGFVGRAVKIKGLHYLLDVLKKINPNNVEFHIAAIKSNEELNYYDEVRRLALTENVIWNEDLDFNQIIKFLDEIDLLIVPSSWLETGPYVIFEAFARKVPVLAFNKGGATELIENNINGWLVDTDEQFEIKLTELINNKEMVKGASVKINEARNTEDLYSEMIKVYKHLN